MSSLADCCSPCTTQIAPLSIPGPQGPTGAAGTNGINGVDAFTLTTASMNVPVDTVTPVTVSVVNSTWAIVGLTVLIGQGPGVVLANPGPASFKITAIPSPNSLTMLWLNQAGDVAATTAISSGALVTVKGRDGAAATFPTTTKGDLIVDDGANSPNAHATRLPVGSNGRAVFADSTQAKGVKYAGAAQTLNANITPVGNGNDATEDDLMSFSVPGATMINNGDALDFIAEFDMAANAHNKTIKVKFGATTILTLGPVAQNGGHVIIRGQVLRTAAATQRCMATVNTTDGAAASTSACDSVTAAENLAGAVLFKFTGQTGVATPNDVLQNSMVLTYRSV